MTNDGTPESGNSVAKVISLLFHPLFMPLYGLLIIFSAPTLLGYLPLAVKKILFIIIAINNVLIPLTLLPFFRFRNIISSYAIRDRKERIIPMLAVTFLYSITSIIVYRLQIPVFLKTFIVSTAFLSLGATMVNFWWKISVHSVGVGALVALVFFLSVKMYTALTWHLIGVILVGGFVLSSRLRLNSHTPAQVWAGFALGLLGIALFMLVF
ncbi:MAG: hypothetical protein K0B05_08355 [Bacteroidales bacterium]|nr:hypothetical protein [Bacteroidales bacterium]